MITRRRIINGKARRTVFDGQRARLDSGGPEGPPYECGGPDATTREPRAGRGAGHLGARGGLDHLGARAAVRALVVKQRSSARSTRPSIAAAVSRITSDTSEMMRNFARSSMRFSRNERLFDLARNVRLLSTSATS